MGTAAISAAAGSNGTWSCTTGSVVTTIPSISATGCVTSTGSIGSGGGGVEPSTHGEYDDDLLHASASEENAEDAPPPRREQKAKMYEKSPYHHLWKTYLWPCKKDLRGGA